MKKQAEVEALRLKMEKNKKPPKKNQKPNRVKDKRKGRHGPPLGHAKYERKLVAEPDHIVEVKPQACKHCQTDLSQEVGQLKDVNQIAELPEAQAEVIEVRQYESICPGCGKKQVGEPPEGMEMERSFGARLEATVVYYRQEQHMSYVRTKATLKDLHGLKISEGGIDKVMQRGGKSALERTPFIQAEIQGSDVLHSDETRSRVDEQNLWQWVFSSAKAVLHVARFDRSVDVIKEVMAGHEAEVWVSDCYKVQMKSPSRAHQLCMAHQLRNLQAVVDQYPSAFWPKAMQALFRAAAHLHNQGNTLSPPAFQAQIQGLERICDRLLQRPGKSPDEKRLLKRYTNYRDCLFVFLHRTDVSPTNNVSERYLRPSVIHRKVIGCFRSGWGAEAYTTIASVIHTAALTGSSPFEIIQDLFGRPALLLPATV